MDILLCSSYALRNEPLHGARAQPYPSLGLLSLAAYIRSMGQWDCGVYDATFSDGMRDFEQALVRLRPRVVGIQGLITTRSTVHSMIQIARHQGCIVVVGGPDPSAAYDHYLAMGADYVVIGEGEITLGQLLSSLDGVSGLADLGDISGLAYKNGDGTLRTGRRRLIENLDDLPFPAYDLIDVERYLETWRVNNGYSSMHIMTSRGCPFDCQWCSHAVFGRSFRQRSVENVISQTRYLQRTYGPEHLAILDDTFALDKKWMETWCDEVSKQGLSIPFRCFSRVDTIDHDSLLKLKSAGCRHIYLGVESGSQRILDLMHKGTTVKQIRTASQGVKAAGIDLGFFIMFAYPGEMAADIRETEDLIFTIEPESLGMSIAYPVPGTPFHEHVQHVSLQKPKSFNTKAHAGRHLVFRATYPEIYYRCLIDFIEARRFLSQRDQLSLSVILKILRMVLNRTVVRAIELLWRRPTPLH
jgi:radical SAM superfamily enzyme YgiQ (UPF0313 family)